MAGIIAAPVTPAAIARVARRANTIVLLGDSITIQDAAAGSTTYAAGTGAVGYFAQANVLMGHPFTPIYNAGVGGERTDQILARVQSDVIARDPGWCSVLAGTNDVAQSIPAATAIANLRAIYDRILSAGIRLVVCTVPPTGYLVSAAQKDTFYKLNAFIKDYAANTGGVVLVDWNSRLVNTADGKALAGLTADGTHPLAEMAYRMGKVWAAAVTPALGGVNRRLVGGPNDPDNLVAGFGMMTGTAGTLGTGGTGEVADGWTLTQVSSGAVFVGAKVARADNVQGAWQQITASGTNAGPIKLYRTVGMGTVAPGDVLDFSCEFEADPDWVQVAGGGVEMMLQVTSSSAGTAVAQDLRSDASSTLTSVPASGVLRTSLVVPANPTGIFMTTTFRIGTGGTLRLGGYELRKRAQ